MNRQLKRMQQKMGDNSSQRGAGRSKTKSKRVSPVQFFKEVRHEMSKVIWPTRKEAIMSTVTVSVTIVFMTALVFGYDFGFGKLIAFIFN